MYVKGVVAYAPPFKVPNQLNYAVHLMSLIFPPHVNPPKVPNILVYITQLEIPNVVDYALPPKVPNQVNWYAVHLTSLMSSLMDPHLESTNQLNWHVVHPMSLMSSLM